MPRISLIICTYNRADLLPRCLAAATAQSLPESDYEVIVVDNGSTDHTRAIVFRWPEVRYLYCQTRGLSAARNTGIAAARSGIAAFIDDDAIANTELLLEVLSVFEQHPDAGCVGGRIELSMPPRIPEWFSQEFAGYYSEFNPGGAEPRRLNQMSEYPFGANLAFRVEAVTRTGYFNEQMGRVGRNQSGGEELDLQDRIARSGYGIYYNPRASVVHVILPDRLRWSHIANTARAAGRNWAYYEVELWQTPSPLRSDIRMLVGALARVVNGESRPFAYSQVLFYWAKALRKVRYRLARRPKSRDTKPDLRSTS